MNAREGVKDTFSDEDLLIYEGGTFGGQLVDDWSFSFLNEKMAAAAVSWKPGRMTSHELFRNTLELLTEKYGRAEVSGKIDEDGGARHASEKDTNFAQWKFPVPGLKANFIDLRISAHRDVSVTYCNGEDADVCFEAMGTKRNAKSKKDL